LGDDSSSEGDLVLAATPTSTVQEEQDPEVLERFAQHFNEQVSLLVRANPELTREKAISACLALPAEVNVPLRTRSEEGRIVFEDLSAFRDTVSGSSSSTNYSSRHNYIFRLSGSFRRARRNSRFDKGNCQFLSRLV
jgi:hypothetical protein